MEQIVLEKNEIINALIKTDLFRCRYEASLNHEIKEVIKEAVGQVIESTVKTKVQDAVAPLVEEVIAEGIDRTDSYGRTLEKKTVKEALTNIISQKKGENYGRSWLDDQVKKCVEAELKPVIPEIKATFRKQVDDLLKLNIADALRSAIGLNK